MARRLLYPTDRQNDDDTYAFHGEAYMAVAAVGANNTCLPLFGCYFWSWFNRFLKFIETWNWNQTLLIMPVSFVSIRCESGRWGWDCWTRLAGWYGRRAGWNCRLPDQAFWPYMEHVQPMLVGWSAVIADRSNNRLSVFKTDPGRIYKPTRRLSQNTLCAGWVTALHVCMYIGAPTNHHQK